MSREKPAAIVLLDLPFELDEDTLDELGPFDETARQTLSQQCRQNRFVLERYDLGVTLFPGGRRGWHLWWRVHFHASPGARFTDAHFEIEWPEDTARVRMIFPEEIERPTRVRVVRRPDGSYAIETLPGHGWVEGEGFTFDYRPTIYGTGEGLPNAWWTFKETSPSGGVGFQHLLHAVVECKGELPAAKLRVEARLQEGDETRKIPLRLQEHLTDLGRTTARGGTVLEAEVASRQTTDAVDLLWRITSQPVPGGWALEHDLSSPASSVEIQRVRGQSQVVPQSQWLLKSRRLFEQLEGLLRRESGGEAILDSEISDELAVLGEDLWLRLVPKEIQRHLRDYGDAVGSLMIETNEPWIPWELVIPDSAKQPPFLCCRYRLARWYSQETGPRLDFGIRRILGVTPTAVEGQTRLPFARAEKDWLERWIQGDSNLDGEVLGEPTRPSIVRHLRDGLFDLFHFAGHGVYESEDPDRARLLLTDLSLRPEHLDQGILQRIGENRPLVFLNACHTGRQGQALTGLGGWPDRWVGHGHCGALICPQWQIRDSVASRFSRLLYEKWRDGAPLGAAMVETRRELYEANPTDPTPLAYSLYGHPNAVVRFGVPSRRPEIARPGTYRLHDPMMERPNPLIARIRRFSAIAADDADLVADDLDGDLRGEVRLSQDLYVERQIEPELQRRLLSSDERNRSLSVIGDAGCGKTSLFWNLYRWLRQRYRDQEVWSLKAGFLGFGAGSRGDYPNASELMAAAGSVLESGRPLTVLVDTADTRLHQAEDRESLSSLLCAFLDRGASLVVSCRPQEARRLPLRVRGKKPLHLENYSKKELTEAIRRHVARFYARPDIRDDQENVRAIRRTVARGKPLREVCENPLTLRMLFVLYAPSRIHDLEINVCRLYAHFWRHRVESDRRAGRDAVTEAKDLSATAGAAALTMLAEGQPEIPQETLSGTLSHFGGRPRELTLLMARGVLRRSEQGTIRFFHQTFFEHAAARGLINWAGLDGLKWASQRFLGALDDLFLAPVFEQAMVLAEESSGSVKEHAVHVLMGLLAERHPPMIRSGLYIYAHRLTEEPAVSSRVVNLLSDSGDAITNGRDVRDGTEPPTAIWLEFAPNTTRHRLPTLFEELQVVWQHGGWNTREKVVELLERLAVREPKKVQNLVERWQILEWFVDLAVKFQADLKVLRVGVALLEDDPEWAWGFLVEVYTRTLELQDYQPSHAEIARAIARGPDSDPATLADRFEQRFPCGPMPRIVSSVVDAHAELWSRQWQARGSDAATALHQLRAELGTLDSVPLYTRLRALTDLLRVCTAEVAEETFTVLVSSLGRQDWSTALRLTVAPLLRGKDPTAKVFRRRMANLLSEALRAESTGDIRLLVDAIRAARPTPNEMCEILAPLAGSPKLWLRRDRLLPVFDLGLAADDANANQALTRMIAQPGDYTSCLKAVSQQFLREGPESELASFAYRLFSASGDVKALLNVVKSCENPPDYLFDDTVAVRQLVGQKSRNDHNQVIRRLAIDVWRHLVRLKVLEPAKLDDTISSFESEKEPKVKLAWVRLLAASSTAELLAQLVPFLADLRDDHPLEIIRKEGGDQLAEVIGSADEPLPYLEEAIIAATQPTVGAYRVSRLSNALSRLCRPGTVGLVIETVERIFGACRDTGTSLTVTQKVGNRLTSVLVKAFRLAGDDLRRPLIESCRDFAFEIARAPIAAAFALADPAPRRWLDEMLIDESVPERTRDLIRRHKYYSERPEGSGGYRELYHLRSAPQPPSVGDAR